MVAGNYQVCRPRQGKAFYNSLNCCVTESIASIDYVKATKRMYYDIHAEWGKWKGPKTRFKEICLNKGGGVPKYVFLP